VRTISMKARRVVRAADRPTGGALWPPVMWLQWGSGGALARASAAEDGIKLAPERWEGR
jgi:hypothetical protein